MAIIDARGFDLVGDIKPFSQGLGSFVSEQINQRLAKQAFGPEPGADLTPEERALAERQSNLARTRLAGRSPAQAGQIGSILQQGQKQSQASQKQRQEIGAKLATGFRTATDKSGFLAAAQQQLLNAGMPDLAADVADDLQTFQTDPNRVIQEFQAAEALFAQNQGQLPARARELEALSQGLSPKDAETARRIELGLDPRAVGSAVQTITEKDIVSDISETEAELAGAKATGKGEAEIPIESRKQIQKINTTRIGELSKGSRSRASSTKKASQFLRALKAGKAHSGAGRAAATFIPGVFTSQGEFDEKFNAFSEVAAREKLKAAGEVRPTDADVEGMKRAIFGVGRDENVNIQLLQEFIADQGDIDNELDDLLGARRAGTLDTFSTRLFSRTLNRDVTEQDISDTLKANPGLTRQQLLQQLEVQ